jgi:hypothetical protein
MAIDTIEKVGQGLMTGLTSTGNSQATAFPLAPRTMHEFTTVANGTGCRLPAASGRFLPTQVTIVNDGENALAVYPADGGTIDVGNANAPVSLAVGDAVTYWASSATNWYPLVSATTGGGGGGATSPGGTSGQIQFDNGGSFGGFTASGDATINTGTGAVTVTKTNGVAFAASATTNTVNASNITTGTLPAAQLPLATTSAFGAVKPDNSTITIASGVISAVGGGGGSLPSVANLDVLANISGAAAVPTGNTMTSIFDAVFGTTVNGIITRGASVWNLVSNLILPTTGPQRYISGTFLNVTGPGSSVSNTTTPTSLFAGSTFRSGQSLTIPANTLLAGDEIEFSLWGTFSVVEPGTIEFQVLVGGTVILQSNVVASTVTVGGNSEWYLGSEPTKIFFPQVGASGTCGGHGQFIAVETPSDNVIISSQMYALNGGTLASGVLNTVNTTAALPLDVRVTWGTAAAGNSIQLLAGTIKKSG